MKLQLALLAGAFFVLIGCGGGGSSSGSQDPVPTNSTAVDLSKMVGTYQGTATVKVTADLVITTDSETYTRKMVATVTKDFKIRINFDDEVLAEGTLSKTAAFSITDTLRNAGFDCDGTVTVEGAIVNTTLRGNIYSKNAECDSIEGEAKGNMVGNKIN